MTECGTCQRLLSEAEKLFAHKGFDAVSVRDIATAAEANPAAINYHFQSKENLFKEVLRLRIAPKKERILASLEAVEALPASERLEALFRGFATAHLEDALLSEGGVLGLRLISKEMQDPRHGASVIHGELIAPIRVRIFEIIRQVLPRLDARQIQLLMGTVVGQLIYFAMNWHNSQRIPPGVEESLAPLPAIADDLETYIRVVIDHVTRIAVAGALVMHEEADS